MGVGETKRRGGPFGKIFVLLLLVGAAFAGWVTFRSGEPPIINIQTLLPEIGQKNTISVRVMEPMRGLSAIKVEVLQKDKSWTLAERTYVPQPAWGFWKPKKVADEILVDFGARIHKGLKSGEATIKVTAGHVGTWMVKTEPVEKRKTLPVRVTPPSLQVKVRKIFVKQGGCEVVIYEVGETSVRDGVLAGDWFFPGYPLPKGKPQERFALFAAPYDSDSPDELVLFATDNLENERRIKFVDKFTRDPFKNDTINVTKSVMARVVPKIMAKTPQLEDQGELVKNYVHINSELRTQNRARLLELSKRTAGEFLWNRSFVRMDANILSTFADRRTYKLNGEEIDKQDHLGLDLASTRHADIPATNSGVVLLTEHLGIYGDAVVIDHGYGLLSLYAHLSTTKVKPGDKVERGQVIGNTGITGMAIGDHLHFEMLLHGLSVTPMEWWDGNWVRDRLALKLGDKLGYVEEKEEG